MKWFKSLFGPKAKKGSLAALPRIDLAKRFELLNRTGQGSMSKVWRARDRSLGRIVCVTLLDKEKTKKFEDRVPGLHRPTEGVICLGLRHKTKEQTFEQGVTAYEIFTHTLPWEKAQSLQTLLSHMNSAGKDPKELRPDLDKPTRAFLLKGIERDVNLRYQTPAEFRDALKRLPKQDW